MRKIKGNRVSVVSLKKIVTLVKIYVEREVEAGEAIWRQDSSSPKGMSLRCLNFPSRAIQRRNILDQVKENLGLH